MRLFTKHCEIRTENEILISIYDDFIFTVDIFIVPNITKPCRFHVGSLEGKTIHQLWHIYSTLILSTDLSVTLSFISAKRSRHLMGTMDPMLHRAEHRHPERDTICDSATT